MPGEVAINLFIEPKHAMDKLDKEPSFWFPLFLMMFSSAAAVAIYFMLVDYDWLSNYMLSNLPKPEGVSAADSENMPQMSKNIVMWMSISAIVIGLPILRLIESTYYNLAGKATGLERPFKYWMSLSCWSSLPLILVLVVSAGMLVAHPNGQVSQEQLNVFSLNELFFHFAPTDKGFSLVTSLTILHPWTWWLVAYGVKRSSNRSWRYCLTFSTLPWIALYGTWAIFVSL